MNFELKNIDQIVRELTVTIDPETYQKDFQKAFAKYSKKIELPGFRKGKAPASAIQRIYGEQIKAFYIEENMNTYYKQGLSETKATPLTTGNFMDANLAEDGTAVFVYQFETFPEGYTYNYKDLKVIYKALEFKDEMVDQTIDNLLKENAEEVPFDADMQIEIGDKIKFMNVATGQEMDAFYLSEQSLKDQFDIDIATIIGLKLNDKFTCQDTEYQVIDAFRKVPPPLNDETAKILGHDNVEAMRTKIKENLLTGIEKQNEDQLNYSISYAFGEANKENIQIPKEYMLDVGKRIIRRHFGAQYGDDFINQFPEDLILNAADQQRPNVIWDLTFEQIAKDNDITVSDEELDIDLARYASDFNISLEEFKSKYSHNLEALRDDLLSRKVIAFIKPYCIIKETADPVFNEETKENTGGDEDIAATGGDKDIAATGGDKDIAATGGDKDIAATEKKPKPKRTPKKKTN